LNPAEPGFRAPKRLPASDSESGGIHAFGDDSSRVEIGRGSGGLKLCGFRFLAAALFTALLLVGCVPVPVVGWTPVFVGGPTAGSADLKQPDYSLGPVSSDQFPDLVKNAIPPSEGAVHLAGRVELLLLSDNRTYILDAVGSLTDAGIALLRWYEPEKQYRILARLPHSGILSLSSNSLGFGRTIKLSLATSVFAWGDQTYAIGQPTSMSFVQPSGPHHDVAQTDTAIKSLQEKKTPIESACDSPIESTDGNI